MVEKTTGFEQFENSNIKISTKVKIRYGLFGNLGLGFMTYWINSFLTAFYGTILGVPMANIGTLMLVCRLFDAVNDPAIGYFLDKRTDKGRGRYRIPMLIGAIGMYIIVILMFAVSPEWESSLKVAWMWIGYLIYTVFNTIYGMSDKALGGVITSNSAERTSVGAFRAAGSSFSTALPGFFATAMFLFFSAQDSTAPDQRGYFITVLIFSTIGLLFCAPASLCTKEVIHKTPGSNISLLKAMKSMLKTPAILIATIGSFAFGLLIYGRVSYMIYFCQYNCNMVELFVYITICMFTAQPLGSFSVAFFNKIIPNKGRVSALGLAMSGVRLLICWFLGKDGVDTSLAPFLISFWIAMFSCGMHAGIINAILPEACDCVELRDGIRVDGFTAALASFAQKAGGAITPALCS